MCPPGSGISCVRVSSRWDGRVFLCCRSKMVVLDLPFNKRKKKVTRGDILLLNQHKVGLYYPMFCGIRSHLRINNPASQPTSLLFLPPGLNFDRHQTWDTIILSYPVLLSCTGDLAIMIIVPPF